ncbi:reverse transcriptase domain-containing protein [Tanacetum coccineum]
MYNKRSSRQLKPALTSRRFHSTPSPGIGSKYVRNMFESPEPRRDQSESPRKRGPERKTMFKRLKKGVFHRLGDKEKVPAREEQNLLLREIMEKENPRAGKRRCPTGKTVREGTRSQDQKERNQVLRKMISPSHIKTYDGSEDPKDHLKSFQAAVKMERRAMPTWCHMFNSTLTGNARVWFDDLPRESIDSYDDLKKAFLENYLHQKKCIKDPVKIHNIKQRDGESTKEFVQRYKLECRDVKGAPECMKISRFMHGITTLN